MRYIIYGPPGTGKTHTLLGHIESFLESTPPDQIGYFTFSKNAAGEGKQRAVDKFKLSYDDLPYFQTLHSFCFNQLSNVESYITCWENLSANISIVVIAQYSISIVHTAFKQSQFNTDINSRVLTSCLSAFSLIVDCVQ